MSAYTQHPGGSVEVTSIGGIRYALDAPLTWEVGRKGSGLRYVSPAGTETDLASIPMAIRWWLGHEPSLKRNSAADGSPLWAGCRKSTNI